MDFMSPDLNRVLSTKFSVRGLIGKSLIPCCHRDFVNRCQTLKQLILCITSYHRFTILHPLLFWTSSYNHLQCGTQKKTWIIWPAGDPGSRNSLKCRTCGRLCQTTTLWFYTVLPGSENQLTFARSCPTSCLLKEGWISTGLM